MFHEYIKQGIELCDWLFAVDVTFRCTCSELIIHSESNLESTEVFKQVLWMNWSWFKAGWIYLVWSSLNTTGGEAQPPAPFSLTLSHTPHTHTQFSADWQQCGVCSSLMIPPAQLTLHSTGSQRHEQDPEPDIEIAAASHLTLGRAQRWLQHGQSSMHTWTIAIQHS